MRKRQQRARHNLVAEYRSSDLKDSDVVVVHGTLQLEHWEALFHLKMHTLLYQLKVNNDVGQMITKPEMTSGYCSFYDHRPKMSGYYQEGRGEFATFWKWNQSSGQIVVNMTLNLLGTPSRYSIKIIKYNNRTQKKNDYPYTLTKHYVRTFKSWLMQISDDSSVQCYFYWCVSGVSHPAPQDEEVPHAWSYDLVCNILDGIPDSVIDIVGALESSVIKD
jgi:hypothetical protein